MGKTSSKVSVLDICINGLLIALVLVSTFINIRLPISVNGGLIHLGNVPLVVASIVFGMKKGAIAGAFGMGLFDLIGGWVLWAPFTFVIRGVMGYVIGWIAERKQGTSMPFNLAAIIIGGIWMIAGYYLAEAIIYQNIYVPLTSIYGNVIQIITAIVLGLPLAMVLKKQNVIRFKGG